MPLARLMCGIEQNTSSGADYGHGVVGSARLSLQRRLTRPKSLGAVKDDFKDDDEIRHGWPPREQACETLKTVRDMVVKEVVKERTTHPGKFPPLGRRAGRNGAPLQGATARGIEVHEEKWGTVTVQHVYKMRCECGRSWFELELPRFVKCPACHQLGLVST
jgi:hypothetical protein